MSWSIRFFMRPSSTFLALTRIYGHALRLVLKRRSTNICAAAMLGANVFSPVSKLRARRHIVYVPLPVPFVRPLLHAPSDQPGATVAIEPGRPRP